MSLLAVVAIAAGVVLIVLFVVEGPDLGWSMGDGGESGGPQGPFLPGGGGGGGGDAGGGSV
jgi:hypothetical protein